MLKRSALKLLDLYEEEVAVSLKEQLATVTTALQVEDAFNKVRVIIYSSKGLRWPKKHL